MQKYLLGPKAGFRAESGASDGIKPEEVSGPVVIEGKLTCRDADFRMSSTRLFSYIVLPLPPGMKTI
ncbi:hypothetical protein ACLB1S_14800 [Escherichia coli]